MQLLNRKSSGLSAEGGAGLGARERRGDGVEPAVVCDAIKGSASRVGHIAIKWPDVTLHAKSVHGLAEAYSGSAATDESFVKKLRAGEQSEVETIDHQFKMELAATCYWKERGAGLENALAAEKYLDNPGRKIQMARTLDRSASQRDVVGQFRRDCLCHAL